MASQPDSLGLRAWRGLDTDGLWECPELPKENIFILQKPDIITLNRAHILDKLQKPDTVSARVLGWFAPRSAYCALSRLAWEAIA
jgi:hypothetical protein